MKYKMRLYASLNLEVKGKQQFEKNLKTVAKREIADQEFWKELLNVIQKMIQNWNCIYKKFWSVNVTESLDLLDSEWSHEILKVYQFLNDGTTVEFSLVKEDTIIKIKRDKEILWQTYHDLLPKYKMELFIRAIKSEYLNFPLSGGIQLADFWMKESQEDLLRCLYRLQNNRSLKDRNLRRKLLRLIKRVRNQINLSLAISQTVKEFLNLN